MEGQISFGDDGADGINLLQQQLQRQLALQQLFPDAAASGMPRLPRGIVVGSMPSLVSGENRISPTISQNQQLVRQIGLNVEMLAKQVDHSDEKLKIHTQYINDLQDENKRLQQVVATMKVDNDQLKASETRSRQLIDQAERRFTDLKREHDELKRTHEEEVRNHAELKERYAKLEEKCDFLTTDNQLLHQDVDGLKTRFDEICVSLRLPK